MTSTYFQLIKDFQKRSFANIYLFYGEEPYYIDELSDYLTEHVLNEIRSNTKRKTVAMTHNFVHVDENGLALESAFGFNF